MLPNSESRTLLQLITHILKRHPYLSKSVIKIATNINIELEYKTVLSSGSMEDKFTFIYKNNWWKSDESRSGPGSTLEHTENLRAELPALIKKYSIETILDAPCGDFNWMRYLLPCLNVNYIGADVVEELINKLETSYGNSHVKFLKLDIIRDKLPRADLMIIRDCLFHFSYRDTLSVLQNFVDSNISYFLTTTHKNRGNFENRDIVTGDFKFIDLFSDPYNFDTSPLCRINDGVSPCHETEMVLFDRNQVRSACKQIANYRR